MGHVSEKISIKVSAGGEFYCYLPEDYLPAVKDVFKQNWKKDGKIRVYADTLAELETRIEKTIRINAEPEVFEEPVIRYNIESHVSFAEDSDGNVFPNTGFPDTKWNAKGDRELYGNHDSAKPCRGGYSLRVGAQAMMKKTLVYGETKRVKYSFYYKDGSHHDHDNPAELLNSWSSFSLPDNAKEIPYTDEAALFFHNLLLGMAQLSKKIQEQTFGQEKLLELIAKGHKLLPEKT
jgi:hypothetical protein